MAVRILAYLSLLISLFGCSEPEDPGRYYLPRNDKIPGDAVKVMPADDLHPPIVHSPDYGPAEPMSGPINTAGAEDSPFMANDRDEFYFFFTPDVRVAVENQVSDSVTGIYYSRMEEDGWSEPLRVVLQDRGKLALDGCQWVHGDSILFCSAREGYTGLHWFLAREIKGKWVDWTLYEFGEDYKIGELHIIGDEVYYHSHYEGGKGGLDIWRLRIEDGRWTDPLNIKTINSEENDGWPFLTNDGKEIWFTRDYHGTPAIFRSKRIQKEWQTPELIISQFAGEPTLDSEGNVYFVHHFYRDGQMIEADIYCARKIGLKTINPIIN